MSKQTVFEGAIVFVQGYEFKASDVVWSADDSPGNSGEVVRFVGTCTADPRNDDIRHTAYNGGVYGGNRRAGYVKPTVEDDGSNPADLSAWQRPVRG
mgnify:FL=1